MNTRFINPHQNFPMHQQFNSNQNTNMQGYNPNMPINHPSIQGFNPNMPVNYPSGNSNMNMSIMNPNMGSPMYNPNMPINHPQVQGFNPNMPINIPSNTQPNMNPNMGSPMYNPNNTSMMPSMNSGIIPNNNNFNTNYNLNNDSGNRFGRRTMTNNNAQETEQQQSFDTVPVFEISNINNISFTGCEHIKLPLKLNVVESNSIIKFEGSYATDCFNEAIEYLIECTFRYFEEHKTKYQATYKKFIITEKIFNITKQDIVSELFATDCFDLNKNLKKQYKDSKTKYEIILFNNIDKQMLSIINEYLYINSVGRVTIDSFTFDFASLNKYLETNEPEMLEFLVEFLNLYIMSFKENINSIAEITEKDDNISDSTISTITQEEQDFVYIDYMACEIGLNKMISGTVMYMPKKSTNAFLVSLFNNIFEMEELNNTFKFNLVTADKEVYVIYKSLKEDLYIKKLT